MNDSPAIRDLLERSEDRREKGSDVTPEELYRDCPELIDTVREKINRLKAFGPPDLAGRTVDMPGNVSSSRTLPTLPGADSADHRIRVPESPNERIVSGGRISFQALISNRRSQ